MCSTPRPKRGNHNDALPWDWMVHPIPGGNVLTCSPMCRFMGGYPEDTRPQ